MPVTSPRSAAGDMLFGMGSKLLYATTRVALPPLALAHMGLDDYGLWSTCFVLVSYVGMTASGFSLVYLRRAAELLQQGNLAGLGALLSTGMLSMIMLTGFLLALLWNSLPWLLEVFRVAPAQQELAQDLWLGAVAIFLADMSLGAFANVLHAMGRIRTEQTVWIIAFLVEAVLIFTFLRLGWGAYGLLAAFGGRYLFSSTTNAFLAWRALPGLRLHWRAFDRTLLRRFFVFGASMQASGLLATGLQSFDRLLAGTLVGPHATALTDLATKLPGTAGSITSSVSSIALSAAARHDVAGQSQAVREVYEEALRLTVAGLMWTMPLLLAFSNTWTLSWLGPSGPHAQVGVLMALSVIGLHAHLLTGPATSVAKGKGLLAPEFAYHGLRALALALGVAVWWGLYEHSELPGFIAALSIAQTIAALGFIAHTHRQLGGSWARLISQFFLPTALGYLAAATLAWGLATQGPLQALACLTMQGAACESISSAQTRGDALIHLVAAALLWLPLGAMVLWVSLLNRTEKARFLISLGKMMQWKRS